MADSTGIVVAAIETDLSSATPADLGSGADARWREFRRL